MAPRLCRFPASRSRFPGLPCRRAYPIRGPVTSSSYSQRFATRAPPCSFGAGGRQCSRERGFRPSSRLPRHRCLPPASSNWRHYSNFSASSGSLHAASDAHRLDGKAELFSVAEIVIVERCFFRAVRAAQSLCFRDSSTSDSVLNSPTCCDLVRRASLEVEVPLVTVRSGACPASSFPVLPLVFTLVLGVFLPVSALPGVEFLSVSIEMI